MDGRSSLRPPFRNGDNDFIDDDGGGGGGYQVH